MRDIDELGLASKFVEFTGSFESRFYDYRMRKHLNPAQKSAEVALVKVDDYSLQKIGVWPIPRSIHAQMIDKLKIFGAKVVALDVLYPEKAPICGQESPDTILAESFKNFQTDGKRVFLAFTTGTSEEDSLKEAPVEMLNDTVATQSSSDVNMQAYKIGRYTFPIEEFVATEVGLGSISSSEDSDGIFRQYQLALFLRFRQFL